MKITLGSIAVAHGCLYGLDANGKVWKYIPADEDKGRFAFWTRITDHAREDNK